MLTDEWLCLEKPNDPVRGTQRIYRFPNGYGLSAVNGPTLHAFPFAWEIAVLVGVQENGDFDEVCYSTPLTNDVEVFETEEEANEFIERAELVIGGLLK